VLVDAPLPAERGLSFGAFASAYETTRPAYPADAVGWLVPGASRRVVELGAGTGKLTRALAAAGHRVLATEPDPRMREVLAGLALPGVEITAGVAEQIPLPDGSADVVVSGSAFHWFDLERALDESARVLRPGGRLAFAWNQKDVRVAWVRSITDVMRRGEPWMGDRPWIELVGAHPSFRPPERARFAHAVELPRDRLADYVCSYTGVASLAAGERDAVVARVEAIVAEQHGTATTIGIPFVVDAYRTIVVT